MKPTNQQRKWNAVNNAATELYNSGNNAVGSSKAEERVITLMRKELETLREVLRVTELAQLTGEPDRAEFEAPNYAFLMEKRERLFETVKSTENKISALRDELLPGARFTEESQNIYAARDECIGRILRLDGEQYAKARTIQEELKAKIKNINNGRTVNSAYLNGSSGSRMLNTEI